MKKALKRLVLMCVTAVLLLSSCISVSAEPAQDSVLNTRNDFMWGINRHSNFYSVYGDANLEEQIHIMAESGATLLRIDISTSDLNSTDKTVKLCNAYGIKVMAVIGSVQYEDTQDYDYDYWYSLMKAMATRYNGKNGHGKIDFFQLDNEVDIRDLVKGPTYGAATTMGEFRTNVMKLVTKSFNNLARGVRDADTDAKIVINHCWIHTGFLDWLVQENVDYDIIGLDWYMDMAASFEKDGKRSAEQCKNIYEKYGKEIIICETNVWYTEAFNEQDVSKWDPLVRIMNDAYSYPYVKGLCIYELCDQTYIQKDTYHIEAHFGLIFADKFGAMKGVKPVYYRIQKIWGGSAKEFITYDSIRAAEAKPEEPKNQETKDNSGTVTPEPESPSSKNTTPNVKENKSEDDIFDDLDDFDFDDELSEDNSAKAKPKKTVKKYVPDEGFVWSVQNTIAVIIGAVGVLAAAAFVVYLVIRNKQIKLLSGK